MDKKYSIVKQQFLNLPSKANLHAILVKIELNKAGYFEHSNIIITDGRSSVGLPVDLDSFEGFENTVHCLDTLIDTLQEARAKIAPLMVEKNIILEKKIPNQSP